ncbi:hypothetical protein GVAV_002579 [Gurleya vavrai]
MLKKMKVMVVLRRNRQVKYKSAAILVSNRTDLHKIHQLPKMRFLSQKLNVCMEQKQSHSHHRPVKVAIKAEMQAAIKAVKAAKAAKKAVLLQVD